MAMSDPRPDTRPHILLMDSGVGGLSVSAEIRRRLPDAAQSYLADDAFRPYGDKTEAQIRARLPGLLVPVVEMLRPDAVVIACNTASTTALPFVRAALDVPVVGVVPAIKPAAALSRTKTIAVLGTPGTVRRSYVDALIDQFADGCHVRLKGSVALVAEARLDAGCAEAVQTARTIALTPGRVDHEVVGRLPGDVGAIDFVAA